MYSLGIDIGGTNLAGGILADDHSILIKRTVPFPGASRPYASIEAMAMLARGMLEETGIDEYKLRGIGLAVPGSIDYERKCVINAHNLGYHDFPLVGLLQEYFPDMRIEQENDANAAALAEYYCGALRGVSTGVLITLGTGVGGGIVIDGRLYAGGDGMGTEIGHIPLVVGGEQCSCGAKGCFEAYASVTALIRDTKRAMESDPNSLLHEYAEKEGKVSGRTSFDCAKKGDKTALAVVDNYMEYVAAGIGGLISTFRPDAILIGGGLSNEGDYLLKPLNERVGKYVFAYKNIGASPIVKASLGNDAGIIGAAYLDRV